MSFVTDESVRERSPFVIKFQFGWNTIYAVAEIPRNTWRHVVRVTIPPSCFQRLLHHLLVYLPVAAEDLARKMWPALFLPTRVFIKLLKPDWDEEFEHEKKMYDKMRPLQGYRIPILFGEGCVDGTRALILSEVNGVMVCDQPRPFRLAVGDFKDRLEPALKDILTYGINHEDPKPTNLLLVDDRFMFVDLESAYEQDFSTVDFDTELDIGMRRFTSMYEMYLRNADDYW